MDVTCCVNHWRNEREAPAVEKEKVSKWKNELFSSRYCPAISQLVYWRLEGEGDWSDHWRVTTEICDPLHLRTFVKMLKLLAITE